MYNHGDPAVIPDSIALLQVYWNDSIGSCVLCNMNTSERIPTPISDRIKAIAGHLGWSDNSHYGDTDYGLGQEFESGPYWVRLEWGPGVGLGVSNELLTVAVHDRRTKPLVTEVFVMKNREQTTMRAAAITALTEYLQEEES